MSCQGSVKAQGLAALLSEKLRYCTIEYVANASAKPSAMKRRIYDIMHGKVEDVSLRVADDICCAAGHPEWLQLL